MVERFDLSSGDDTSSAFEWGPEELDAFERLQASMADVDPGAVHAPSSSSSEPVSWRCLRCDSASWQVDDTELGTYKCLSCGHDVFYHTLHPAQRQTVEGTWTFIPKAGGEDQQVNGPQPHVSQRQFGDPSKEPTQETFESERHTTDPSVDPSSRYDWPMESGSLAASSTSSRRRRKKGKTTAQTPNPNVDSQTVDNAEHVRASRSPTVPHLPVPSKTQSGTEQSELLQVLKQLLDDRRGDSTSSWNSRKGPAPGLKWRGGSPPQPPKWQYASTDLRAFAKYERRVQVWQMQVQHYLTGAEAGLMLFSSLSGEPEAEAEHMDLEKINAKDGVAYILSCLKGPLEQKLLYQKRMLLSNYENIARQGHETVRQFINRYKRVERDLQSVGISSAAMYDAESRGNRILERCKLDPSLQRLVLIGAQCNLDFDSIVESLQLQFPDFRPTPAVFQSGGWRQNNSSHSHYSKGSGKSAVSSSSSTTVPSSASAYNRSKGKGGPRRVFQAEQVDPADGPCSDTLHDIPEEEAQEEFFEPLEDQADEEGDQQEPEDGEPDGLDESLENLATVLSVTSKKLQSTVLGRKFSGRRSIEERKRTSACSACGAMGHWAGDAACSASSTGKSAGKKQGQREGAVQTFRYSSLLIKCTFDRSTQESICGYVW